MKKANLLHYIHPWSHNESKLPDRERFRIGKPSYHLLANTCFNKLFFRKR
jgi:hypothetical protein